MTVQSQESARTSMSSLRVPDVPHDDGELHELLSKGQPQLGLRAHTVTRHNTNGAPAVHQDRKI
jgi:hypothetical protein